MTAHVVPEVKKLEPAPKAAKPKKVKKTSPKAQKPRNSVPKRRKMAKKATRKPFPYLRVLKLWRKGKSIAEIAKAVGKFDKKAADPLHGFRVTLTRFHAGVKLDGRLVKLPHRISKKALRAATKAGKKAARG